MEGRAVATQSYKAAAACCESDAEPKSWFPFRFTSGPISPFGSTAQPVFSPGEHGLEKVLAYPTHSFAGSNFLTLGRSGPSYRSSR